MALPPSATNVNVVLSVHAFRGPGLLAFSLAIAVGTKFITQKLKLKVNETKSAAARPQQRKFLGFSFTDGPEIKRTIAPKALERFKHRIREVTLRAKGVSLETTIAELASYLRGWRSYFGFCETPYVLIS